MSDEPSIYAAAGVDTEAGDRAVELMRAAVVQLLAQDADESDMHEALSDAIRNH